MRRMQQPRLKRGDYLLCSISTVFGFAAIGLAQPFLDGGLRSLQVLPAVKTDDAR